MGMDFTFLMQKLCSRKCLCLLAFSYAEAVGINREEASVCITGAFGGINLKYTQVQCLSFGANRDPCLQLSATTAGLAHLLLQFLVCVAALAADVCRCASIKSLLNGLQRSMQTWTGDFLIVVLSVSVSLCCSCQCS